MASNTISRVYHVETAGHPPRAKNWVLALAETIILADAMIFTAGPVTAQFDKYIGPGGLSINDGSLLTPWDLASLNTKQSQYKGKKLGILPGTYDMSTLGTVGAGGPSFNVPVVNVPGGTDAAHPTVVGSCDTHGNYAPAGSAGGLWAILDGGQSDTAKSYCDQTTTGSLLSDSTASMTVNQYADGSHYLVYTGSVVDSSVYTFSLITANTATTITPQTAMPRMAPHTVTAVTPGTPTGSTGTPSNPGDPGSFTCSGNYSPNDAVMFQTTGTLPGGLVAGTRYGVTKISSTAFVVTAPIHNGAYVTITSAGTGTLTVVPAGVYFVSNNPNSTPMIGTSGPASTNSFVTIEGFEMQNCTGRTVDMRMPNSVGPTQPRCTYLNVNDCYIHDQYTAFGGGDNTTAVTFTSVDGTVSGTTNNTSGTTNCTFARIFVTDGSGRSDAIEYWGCWGCTSLNNTIVCAAPFTTTGTNISGMLTQDMSNANAECINYKNHGNSNLSILGNYVDAHLAGPGSGGGFGMDYDNSSPYAPNNTNIHAFNCVNAGTAAAKAVAGVSLPFQENEKYYNNTFICASGGSAPTGINRFIKLPGRVTCFNNIYATTGAWYSYGASSFNIDVPILVDFEMFAGAGGYKRTSAPVGGTGITVTYTTIASYAASLPADCVGKEANSVVTAGAAGFVLTGALANKYQLSNTSPFKNKGNTTGNAATGVATDPGCWGNGNTQVGSTYAAALGFT